MPKRDRVEAIPDLNAQKIRGSLTASKLTELPLSGVIGTSITMKSKNLDLFLGGNSYIAGDITELHGITIALIHQIYVSRLLRGRGVGKKLFKGFVAEAKHQGAEELWSDNISNMALGLRKRVFGSAALQFYDSDNPTLGFLPMTYEQAISTNNRVLSTIDPTDGEPICGDIGAYVNLRQVDTSEWPRVDDLEIADLSLLDKS